MKEIKDIYNMTKEENIFCAKRVLVDSIYKQANLEGIGVTFAETQDILNNVNVDKVTPTDMSKVCCLRDGWHYLFDHLDEPVDLVFLESIHELTARFDVPYQYLGKLRVDDVMISGTDWRPEIPDVETIYRDLQELNRIECITDRALSIGLYIMRTLDETFPDKLETEYVAGVDENNVEQVLEDIIKSGADIVFCVGPQMMPNSLKVAVEHPEVYILNCSLNAPHPYIRTYYGRMYEAKFLAGMIAGAVTDNERVAYIADYPIYGMIANINAFALGVASVNPRQTAWRKVWCIRE